MRASAKTVLSAGLTAIVVGGLVSTVMRDRASEPYTVPKSALSGWVVVAGHPDDPWVLAVRPPAALSATLFEQLSRKTRGPIAPLDRSDLPLVLRTEYADALQGMWSADEIARVARDSGIETSTFQPVCMGRKSRNDGTAPPAEFFFVAFKSTVFERLRADLQPDFPEHAGIITYDPHALVSLLPIGATTRTFDGWWPVAFDPLTDCQAQLTVR